jgi:Zn-dependent peptidase ImmA (M78 family)
MTKPDALQMNLPRNRAADILQQRPRVSSKGDRMLTWADAHRIAHMAAAQAFRRLSVDITGVNVDVFEAIKSSQTVLMFQPMPRLFGAYLAEEGSTPGIIINSGLPRGARRHTAAHELGHAQLGHTTSVDDGSTIDSVIHDETDAIPPASHRRSWTDQEKVAEAFASWFLMPSRVVRNALNVLRRAKPNSAADVYQLSLLLGTSYRTTLRHLSNLKLAPHASITKWATVAPGTLKNQLDVSATSNRLRRAEVYRITEEYGGLNLSLEPGDRLIVPSDLYSSVALPELIDEVGTSNLGAVLEVADVIEDQSNGSIDNGVGFSLQFSVSEAPQGLDPRSLQ